MAALERRAAERYGISVATLMENAGARTAEVARRLLAMRPGRRVVVLAGKGNNGGDGLVAARHLRGDGSVRVLLAARAAELRDEPGAQLARLRAHAVPVTEAEEMTAEELAGELRGSDLLVDALFGTGFRGPARGVAARLIEAANSSGVPVLAVDVPSGVDAETGRAEPPCIRAAATVTMGLPKVGLVQYPAAGYAGRLYVADIGFPPELLEEAPISTFLVRAGWVAGVFPRRAPDSHKGHFGRAGRDPCGRGPRHRGRAQIACHAAPERPPRGHDPPAPRDLRGHPEPGGRSGGAGGRRGGDGGGDRAGPHHAPRGRGARPGGAAPDRPPPGGGRRRPERARGRGGPPPAGRPRPCGHHAPPRGAVPAPGDSRARDPGGPRRLSAPRGPHPRGRHGPQGRPHRRGGSRRPSGDRAHGERRHGHGRHGRRAHRHGGEPPRAAPPGLRGRRRRGVPPRAGGRPGRGARGGAGAPGARGGRSRARGAGPDPGGRGGRWHHAGPLRCAPASRPPWQAPAGTSRGLFGPPGRRSNSMRCGPTCKASAPSSGLRRASSRSSRPTPTATAPWRWPGPPSRPAPRPSALRPWRKAWSSGGRAFPRPSSSSALRSPPRPRGSSPTTSRHPSPERSWRALSATPRPASGGRRPST